MPPETSTDQVAKYKEMREQIQASDTPWYTVITTGTTTKHTDYKIFDQDAGGNRWAKTSPDDQILFDLKAKVEEMEAMLGAAWMAITELQEIIDGSEDP